MTFNWHRSSSISSFILWMNVLFVKFIPKIQVNMIVNHVEAYICSELQWTYYIEEGWEIILYNWHLNMNLSDLAVLSIPNIVILWNSSHIFKNVFEKKFYKSIHSWKPEHKCTAFIHVYISEKNKMKLIASCLLFFYGIVLYAAYG